MANTNTHHAIKVKPDLHIRISFLKQIRSISVIAILGCAAAFNPNTALSASCESGNAFSDSLSPYISGKHINAFVNTNDNQTSPWTLDQAINMSRFQSDSQSNTGYQFQGALQDQLLDNNFSALDREAIKEAAHVPFDGHLLSRSFLQDIAQDPIVEWDFVRDEDCQIVEGEVWMIVAREDKFIFFHLVDTLNLSAGTTAYSGYDVKIKNVYMATFYEPGAGADIPQIGNDNEMFFVAEHKMLINSKYDVSPYTQTLDNANFGVGEGADALLHVADIVVSQNIPQEFSSSAIIEPNTVVQIFLPSGELISEEVTVGTHAIASSIGDLASSTGSPAWCEGAGDVAENTHNVGSDLFHSALWGMNEAFIVGVSAFIGASEGPAGVGTGTALATAFSLANTGAFYAANKVGENIAAPTLGALVEAACDVAFGNTPDLGDDLLKILGDMLGVQGSVDQEVVCDNWEAVDEETESDHDSDQLTLDVLQTSEIEDETSEEVTVWGDDDGAQTCTEWHVVTTIDPT